MQSPTQHSKNPVESRLEELADAWNSIADCHDVRVVRWLIPADASKLLETFFELQRAGWQKSSPDLFLNFSSSYEEATSYSLSLRNELISVYESNRTALQKEGVVCDWEPPDWDGQNPHQSWLSALESFQSRYADHFEYIAPVLMPNAIASHSGFANWLDKILKCEIGKQIRLCAIDRLEDPQLGELAERFPAVVYTLAPKLDMNAVIREVVAKAGGTGPGAIFRRLFIDLTQLVTSPDLEKLKTKAVAAIAIAQHEQWYDQQVVVHMLLAAAYHRAQRYEDALKSYEAARDAAEEAVKTGHPAGQKLVAQALFGKAALYISMEKFLDAAHVYEAAAEVTKSARDELLTIEAFRMASYCYERQDMPRENWHRGWSALDVGVQMAPDDRHHTTLAYAGDSLIRVVDKYYGARVQDVETAKQVAIASLAQRADDEKAQLGGRGSSRQTAAIDEQLRVAIDAEARSASEKRRPIDEKWRSTRAQVEERMELLLGPDWRTGIVRVPPSSPSDLAATA